MADILDLVDADELRDQVHQNIARWLPIRVASSILITPHRARTRCASRLPISFVERA
jgi:hypothetical protein